MGTSQTSHGPGSGVAMVPPWADDVDDSTGDPDGGLDGAGEEDKPPVPTAPPGRFRDARRSIGGFTRTGNTHDLQRALRHYVSSGYGGSGTMSRRFGGTAATAGRLNSVLSSGTRPDGTALRDATLTSGTDVNDVLDAIVDAVRPGDGTQDAESSRLAVRDALVALLERFPDADPLSLTDAQREFVIERYAALDVFGRFCLDLRATIMDKAADAATGLNRLKQVRAFINEQVSAAFRNVRERGGATNTANVASLTRQALREAFSVFEEYLS